MDDAKLEVLDRAVRSLEDARRHYLADVDKYEKNANKMEDENMSEIEHTKEYASSGVGTAGLTTGIIGAAGWALNAMGNGGLGGLFGGGNNIRELADARAEIAQLRSEKYTDSKVLSAEKQLSAVDERLHAVDDKLQQAIFNNAKDIAALDERVRLQNQIDNLKAEKDILALRAELQSQIATVANASTLGIQQNANAIACLTNTVNNLQGMTTLGISQGKIIPSSCSCGCGVQ